MFFRSSKSFRDRNLTCHNKGLSYLIYIYYFNIKIVFYCSQEENSSVTVMWTSFHAAEKKPEISTDGLHYGPSITSLVIMDSCTNKLFEFLNVVKLYQGFHERARHRFDYVEESFTISRSSVQIVLPPFLSC